MTTIVTVTVHNSNDPECYRLTLSREYELHVDPAWVEDGITYEEAVSDALRNQIIGLMTETERVHREAFPKGMSYSVPYTVVDVRQEDEVTELERETLDALRSGQARVIVRS